MLVGLLERNLTNFLESFMLSHTCLVRVAALVVLGWMFVFPTLALEAQEPTNQQKIDDTIRSAEQLEMLGHILGGAGFLVILLVIPYGIYADRKKKASKLAQQSNKQKHERDPVQREPGE